MVLTDKWFTAISENEDAYVFRLKNALFNNYFEQI